MRSEHGNTELAVSPSGTEVLTPTPLEFDQGPSFRQAMCLWVKLGFVSFGGPAGQIAIMHRELVERRRWISEDRFLHALDYCMLLPGPEAQQLATYAGWVLHRAQGGLAAGILFVLPSIFVLLGLSYLYVTRGETRIVVGVLDGIRPAVVAIVCEAVLRIRRRAVRSRADAAISVGAFAAVAVARVPFPVVIFAAALCGWVVSAVRQSRARGASNEGEGARSGSTPGMEKPVLLPLARHAGRVLAVCASLWLAGLLAVIIAAGFTSLLVQQYLFFTKAAFVTFGGAYAVLAYVAQAAVGQLGWLTHAQTVDGLALAETTPGPLIMVVQFVGFTAAWNHPITNWTPLQSAVAGAIVTTFVTFLPSFMLVFIGAPFIEQLHASPKLAGALRAVTAAVLGAVLNLAFVFGSTVLFPSSRSGGFDWFSGLLAVGSFVALWRLRVDVLALVLGAGILGSVRGLLVR